MTTSSSKFYQILKKYWVISLLLFLILLDRIFTLAYFGFPYTDVDQIIMWDGANDYAQGIFREPYFYGQDYNFMIEALIAVPLLWLNIPVHQALPITTTFIGLLPFICTSIFLWRMKKSKWSYVVLLFLLLLPIEYNSLTTISRGFLQAHLFFPFVIYGFLHPTKTKFYAILFIATGLCFISNTSSIILLLPVLFYIFLFNYKRIRFYLSSILILPILLIQVWAKQFYSNNPNRIEHSINGLYVDFTTFIDSISSTNHFNYLFPFNSSWGYLYIILILSFIVYAAFRKKFKVLAFFLILLFVLLGTFSIPKVQVLYENAGVLFSRSRLYTSLPLVFILGVFILLKDRKFVLKPIWILPLIALIIFSVKNFNSQADYVSVAATSMFPMEDNPNLIKRQKNLHDLATKYKVDLVLHENKTGWLRIFDNYAFKAVNRVQNNSPESTSIEEERRTWVLEENKVFERILLNDIVIPPDSKLYKNIKNTEEGYPILINNTLPLVDLFKEIRRKDN